MLEYAIAAAILSPPLIIIVAHLTLYKPRLFYGLYIILSTRVFGFVPMGLSVQIPRLLFFLHVVMLLSVVALLLMKRDFSNRKVLLFLGCIFALVAFGILYPYSLGFSGILSAVVDGKDMFGYAGLAYLAINRRHFDFRYFLRLFSFVAFVLSLVLIVGQVTDFCPPGYFRLWGSGLIQVDHVTYIVLAAFLVASRALTFPFRFSRAYLFLFLSISLFFQGHRSVVLTAFPALSILWLFRANPSLKFLSVLAVLPFLLGVFFLDDSHNYLEKMMEPIGELSNKETGAIASRNQINLLRYNYMDQRPLFGYGFIDETSSLGAQIADQSVSRFDQSLGVVDSGYVDMRIRFGLAGTLCFCIVLGFLLFDRLMNRRLLDNGQIAMALFLSTYFLINYTWSVFTYDFGIIASSAALFLLCHKKKVADDDIDAVDVLISKDAPVGALCANNESSDEMHIERSRKEFRR